MTGGRGWYGARGQQAGFTLLEVIVALVIFAAVLVGVAQLMSRTSDETKAAVTAGYMRVVAEAASAYIDDNWTSGVNIRASATATAPFLISVDQLVADNYLQGFDTAGTNPYGQDVCVLVLEPVADIRQALVVASGGDAIDDLTLGGIAAKMGIGGAGVYARDNTIVEGASGTWNLPKDPFDNNTANGVLCDGAAGAGGVTLDAGRPALALWMMNLAGAVNSDEFLHRNAQTNRDLNTMNTPILFDNGGALVRGAACTAADQGAIAAESTTGFLLSCADIDDAGPEPFEWHYTGGLYFSDPVADYATLTAQSCTAESNGQVRVTLNTDRAFTCNAATGNWVALAVDENGDLNVPRDLTVTRNATITGTADITGAVRARNNLQVDGNTTLGDANTDTTTMRGMFMLPDARAAGSSCLGNANAFARDSATNALLYCNASDVWTAHGGTGAQIVALGPFAGTGSIRSIAPQEAMPPTVVNCPPTSNSARVLFGGRYRTPDDTNDIALRIRVWNGGSDISGSDVWVGAVVENAGIETSLVGIPFSAVANAVCSPGFGGTLTLSMTSEQVTNRPARSYFVSQTWMWVLFN